MKIRVIGKAELAEVEAPTVEEASILVQAKTSKDEVVEIDKSENTVLVKEIVTE